MILVEAALKGLCGPFHNIQHRRRRIRSTKPTCRVWLALAFIWTMGAGAAEPPRPIEVQNEFDAMGPAMRTWVDGNGKTLH